MRNAKRIAISAALLLVAVGGFMIAAAAVKGNFDLEKMKGLSYEMKTFEVKEAFSDIHIEDTECNVRILRATDGECKVICPDKQDGSIYHTVYVPTDFDTIEKAFSGVKTAEKGIKQGLSRSITDSESPFSLYSVVDFCRSKVRRHRGV